MTLTPRQEALLEFIRETHRSTGQMPTTREIQNFFGFASQTAAIDLLRALERKGSLRRVPGKARAIFLTDHVGMAAPPAPRIVCLPLYGRVTAGYAGSNTELHGEFLRVDAAAHGLGRADGCFALRVRGDSMSGAHILEGDCVILDSRQNPQHRDIVAALIDGETTLKRLIIDGPLRWLQAEHPLYPNLLALDDLLIQGVMRGLVRVERDQETAERVPLRRRAVAGPP